MQHLTLYTAGCDTVNKGILGAEKYHQGRNNGNQGHCQNPVPLEAYVAVHRHTQIYGVGIFIHISDIDQRALEVIVGPHELKQGTGYQ